MQNDFDTLDHLTIERLRAIYQASAEGRLQVHRLLSDLPPRREVVLDFGPVTADDIIDREQF